MCDGATVNAARGLTKKYQKYLSHGQDNEHVLFYILQQLMREELQLQVCLCCTR